MINFTEEDKKEFQELWNIGYTGSELQEYFRKKFGRKTLSSGPIKRIKKELDIVGMPLSLPIDKNLEKVELMWQSNKYSKKDICKDFNTTIETLNNRARDNNWGKFTNYISAIVFDETQEQLKKILNYNLYTGIFTWIYTTNGHIKKGSIAGNKDTDGYIRIGLNNKSYKAHRLAFLYVEGKLPKKVDHKNHIRHDNKWNNLRNVTNIENSMNQSLRKNSISGHSGVSYNTRDKKWVVSIKIPDSYKYYQKRFNNKQKAIAVSKAIYVFYGYYENHGEECSVEYNNTSRIDLIRKQTPKDVDKDLLQLILDNTPEGYHDDHIKPLSKGGLHEPSNIQYITAEENLKKGNTYPFICESSIDPIVYLIERGILDEKPNKIN